MSRTPEQVIASRTHILEALGYDTDTARLMATETLKQGREQTK